MVREQIIKASASLLLSASISGKPFPSVSWTKNGDPVDEERIKTNLDETGKVILKIPKVVNCSLY